MSRGRSRVVRFAFVTLRVAPLFRSQTPRQAVWLRIPLSDCLALAGIYITGIALSSGCEHIARALFAGQMFRPAQENITTAMCSTSLGSFGGA